MNKKIDKIKSEIALCINGLFALYLSIDNTLVVGGKTVNLKQEKIKKVSLDNDDISYYFDFYNALSLYRERLKQKIADSNIDFLFGNESRVKNINSISSKIYQYINLKKEKGDVSINKCLNDLYGVRIIVPLRKMGELLEIVNTLSRENNWKCRITDASKQEYKAIHLYLLKDNYSLRWEVQFWLEKYDATNRASHAKYKQSYTNWESSYSVKELYRVVKND